MSGRIIHCTPADIIRIAHDGRVTLVPVESVLAVDRVLTECRVGHSGLTLTEVRPVRWLASIDGRASIGSVTPWAALVALAWALEGRT